MNASTFAKKLLSPLVEFENCNLSAVMKASCVSLIIIFFLFNYVD